MARTAASAHRFFSPPLRAKGARLRSSRRPVRAPLNFLLRQLHLAQPEGDLVFNAPAEQLELGILKDKSDPAMKLSRPAAVRQRPGRDGHAVKAVFAGVCKGEPGEDAEQRGFAATVGALQAVAAAAFQPEADIAQRRCPVRVYKTHMFQFHDTHSNPYFYMRVFA